MENKIAHKKYLGLEILKLFLSFWVVTAHCCEIEEIRILLTKIRLHVPTFIIISFFFLYSSLSNRNIQKLKNRFFRLLISYIGYTFFILIFNSYILFSNLIGSIESFYLNNF